MVTESSIDGSSPRILIVCSLARSLRTFRGDLILDLIASGHRVCCMAPDADEDTRTFLRKAGAELVLCRMRRTGMNAIHDIVLLWRISRTIASWKPDVLFSYTIKPVIYGGLAARLFAIPNVPLITGLGSIFAGSNALLRKVAERLYRIALARSPIVIFQNRDDEALFRQRGLLGRATESVVVPGSGINLRHFSPKPPRTAPTSSENLRFLMTARLIEQKGLLLYIAAARVLKARYPGVRFDLLGDFEPGNASRERAAVGDAVRDGVIDHLGWTDDVREHLSTADVFVLPTFYREGVPRTILEALATGLVIITTDTPGCRETVIEGKNGYLIESRSAAALIDALGKVVEDADRIPEMGARSREHAMMFDVTSVNKTLLSCFDIAATSNGVTVR